ncbi:MAG: hypothetical protein ACOC4M_15435, partial [Promethearchaeia archaeon]
MSEKNNWNGSENPQPLDNEEKNEEEISAEAYEHVKHALSLMESEYFDDAIKSMQVAKELYSSIGREEEISIIREKISDIYTMKEQVFSERATESKMEVESEPSAPGIEQEKEKKEPKIEYSRKDKEIILNEAYEFLERGEKLANTDYFDDALKNLKDAKQLFNKIGNDNEIDRVAAKIEEVIAEKEARIK